MTEGKVAGDREQKGGRDMGRELSSGKADKCSGEERKGGEIPGYSGWLVDQLLVVEESCGPSF